jgi:hypothetical protein
MPYQFADMAELFMKKGEEVLWDEIGDDTPPP